MVSNSISHPSEKEHSNFHERVGNVLQWSPSFHSFQKNSLTGKGLKTSVGKFPFSCLFHDCINLYQLGKRGWSECHECETDRQTDMGNTYIPLGLVVGNYVQSLCSIYFEFSCEDIPEAQYQDIRIIITHNHIAPH